MWPWSRASLPKTRKLRSSSHAGLYNRCAALNVSRRVIKTVGPIACLASMLPHYSVVTEQCPERSMQSLCATTDSLLQNLARNISFPVTILAPEV